MADVDTVLDRLIDEFESGDSPEIESYVRRYPQYRDELLDLWVVLSTSPRFSEQELASLGRRVLSRVERDSVRDLCLAVSLGPEMLEGAGEMGEDQTAALGAELARLRGVPYVFRGKAPATFRRIAVYSWIAGVLAESAPGGVSRLRVQKVAYLLEHGLSLGVFSRHKKHRFGPYDPSLTYRDAEPGSLKGNYLEKGEDDLLRPGPKLAKAMGYASGYLREETVARALVDRLQGLDEWALETLTTVHAVVGELEGDKISAEAVRRKLGSDPKWKGKLRRRNFTAEKVEEALELLVLLRLI